MDLRILAAMPAPGLAEIHTFAVKPASSESAPKGRAPIALPGLVSEPRAGWQRVSGPQ